MISILKNHNIISISYNKVSSEGPLGQCCFRRFACIPEEILRKVPTVLSEVFISFRSYVMQKWLILSPLLYRAQFVKKLLHVSVKDLNPEYIHAAHSELILSNGSQQVQDNCSCLLDNQNTVESQYHILDGSIAS